jgi:ABC-2 type transport system permease protein
VRLYEAGLEVERIGAAPDEVAAARLRVEEGTLGGLLEVGDETLERGSARWVADGPPSPLRRLQLQEAVTAGALEVTLGGVTGAETARALLDGGALEVVRLDASGPGEDERTAGIVAGMVGGFLLYFVMLVYGTMVLRAVLEEKTNRIVEIIVSSVRPWELMLGKILGVGAVGLTQLAVWVGSAALLLAFVASSALPFLAEGDALEGIREAIPPVGVLLFFAVCFLMGYFTYASLFAAVGAACTTEEEAHQLQFPVVMLVVIPVVLLMPVMERPDSAFAVGLSLFPYFSPILMFGRVAAGAAGVWEALAAVVLMVGGLLGTAWIAGRIYRVGILMQGKRPTLPELIRWVRES